MDISKFPKSIIDSVVDGEKIITRFPPEPNGYLHLGHLKAICINFGFALHYDGDCILRFDDTNPLKESNEFIESIIENISWLEFNPNKITYTSDYFDILYDFAIVLIKKGSCYVCSLKLDEISEYRKNLKDSPYKTRSIEENLELFEKMRNGDDTHCLRMKGDLSDPRSCMWDLVFYRVLNCDHIRTGSKWKMYPTYDFSHCIIDSIENITHSFCTTEFETRRASYFWLLDELKLRKPIVYEFGKFSVENNTLSKRKIINLINDKIVNGFDDPRLLTINGLRERGYTKEVLKSFICEDSINKVESIKKKECLEFMMRDYLNKTVPRRFAVFDPIEIIIDDEFDATLYDFPIHMMNIKDGNIENLSEIDLGTRNYKVKDKFFISSKDYRETDSKKYYGIALDKTVRLRYGPFIKCIDNKNDIIVKIDKPDNSKKIKGCLSWIASNGIPAKFRFFDGYNIDEKIGLVEESLNINNLKPYMRFQFERIGYFIIDKSSFKTGKLIFNEIVGLRDKFKI